MIRNIREYKTDPFGTEEASLIEPGLYISNIESATNKPYMERLQITHILSLDLGPIVGEARPSTLRDYLWINAHDNETEDLISKFSQTNAFIASGQLNGGRVVVHCVAGMSRSATIVIAYLMKKYSQSMEETIKFVESKRDIIFPNPGFCSQLRLYETMRWNIDPYNLHYRKLILNWLRIKIKTHEWRNGREEWPPKEIIDEYMVKLRSLDGDPSYQDHHGMWPNNGNRSHALANGNAKEQQQQQQQAPQQSAIYKCKNCRLFLFRDLNVIANNINTVTTNSTANNILNNWLNNGSTNTMVGGDETDSASNGVVPTSNCLISLNQDEKPCGNIYIEPQDWMMSAITLRDAGNLSCKNCSAKLGAWNWRGFWCGCPTHDNLLSLMIKIDSKKVDRHMYLMKP